MVEQVLPGLRIDLTAGAPLDWRAQFPAVVDDLWLEVGFGGGEHLAWQAQAHPNVALIGCEPFLNGIASLVRAVDAQALHDRVRIHGGDAMDVLDVLPDNALGRCFVLFPDPWPKRRHWPRRFIGPESLGVLARIMRPGAELRVASDDPRLVDWMLWHLRAHAEFQWLATSAADFLQRPADWPETRYERKQLRGRPVFLTFRRR